MYIKKIVIAISIIGLFIMGGFSYYVYNVMFASNTNFSQDFKYIYIRSNSDYNDLIEQLKKYIVDPSTFTVLAERKNYVNNINPGKFVIRKGINNNQKINSIRSKNIPAIRLSSSYPPKVFMMELLLICGEINPSHCLGILLLRPKI